MQPRCIPLKPNVRFDYARLAEVLQERGMVDPNVLRELLAIAQEQGGGFTEALVSSGYVSDWDLSRVTCEIFQLPFLPVGVFAPDARAVEGLDKKFLLQHALVPVARFGQVLTIAMPGLVPAEVLGMLAAENDLVVLPVVGTVQTNRNWVEANLVEVEAKANSGWSELFDEADAAVMGALHKIQPGEVDAEAETAVLEFAIAEEDSSTDLSCNIDPTLDLQLDSSDDLGTMLEPDYEAAPRTTASQNEPVKRAGAPGLNLPPAPKF